MERKDDISWTTMISGYSQCGRLDKALRVFEMMTIKNSTAWNAVIAAHVQNNRFHDAFELFDRMMEENVEMDSFVAASMLAACTGLGTLERGEWIHERMETRGIRIDAKLAKTLMDMYCKCGRLDKAVEVFDGLRIKGISSWNCMIGGFAMHGRGRDAIGLLKRMEAVAGSCDVCECSCGLCALNINEARRGIYEMPMSPDIGVLGALLRACRIHRNLEMAEEVS
ncbi:hypothetical protein SASPL_141136 [Salvia splendens]|uniref:Pentatricopeptide repeat-containing protein n=1 Tax=Salvia splendens TaxID=180675 RepID=A0A8X8WRL7_SALSN|nr:hypothetical protein SASPL_141136 [Salvia splendens]